MSMAIASAPPAPLPNLDRNPSPRSYPTLAPSTAAPSIERSPDSNMENGMRSIDRTPPDGKKSPRTTKSGGPKIVVKKEPPSSPSMQPGARHRPQKLDLNTNTSSMHNSMNSRPSATPLTARDSLGKLQEVGLACLSPGFQTQDPTMREQLQRSISVRDQQRSIIESRLLKSAKGDGPDMSKSTESLGLAGKGPLPNNKKRPPPGLSIVPPSAERFANERVVQSAPLNQTFTGRHDPHPSVRQMANQPSGLSQASNIHHMPAVQTSNRLPPISDVFGNGEFNPTSRPPFLHTNSQPIQSHGPPMPSPGYPPQTAHPMSQPPHHFERPREYRSAEEAVQEMTGGREELLPKIVHYGGHQPPTPPSPHPRHPDNLTPHKHHAIHPTGRRRSRNEYEADSSPPLGSGRERRRHSGPFGEGRDSPATQRAKKDEFLSLCARAWDLFHS